MVKDMPLRVCAACDHTWLERKILDEKYYDSLIVHTRPEKLQSRIQNSQDRIRTIRKHIPIHTLCDIGTGEGTFLEVLKGEGINTGYGIEPSEEGVTHAAKVGTPVYKGGISDIPRLLKEHPADVLTMFHVIEHLDDPLSDMKLLFDAMNSGTYLVIETPDIHGYTPSTIGDAWKLFYPEHLTYFSRRSLRTLLEKTGFNTVAQGRRDFDPHHFPVTDALFRLGLKKPSVPSKKILSPDASAPSAPKKSSTPSWLRSSIITILSALVRMFQRYDYQWIIVRKP